MKDQDKRKLIHRYIEACNPFNIDGMMATVHPDIEFETIAGEEITVSNSGIKEFRQITDQAKQLFTEREQNVTKFDFADSDKVSVEIDYNTVLALDLPNNQKAGDTLRLSGRSEFQFKDGKISSILDYI